MATIEEVRHKAGRLLGVTRFGQALRAEDDQLLAEAYTQVYDELKDEGLDIWAPSGVVPDKIAPHLAALMAFNVVDDKGVSAERYSRILNQRNIAKPEIRKYATPPYESVDEPADY